jgi:hypothetical protein
MLEALPSFFRVPRRIPTSVRARKRAASSNAWYRCAEDTVAIVMQTLNVGTARNTAAGFTVPGYSNR